MDKEKIKEMCNNFNIFLSTKIVPFVVDILFITFSIRIAIIKDNIWSAVAYFLFINFIIMICTILYIIKQNGISINEIDLNNLKKDICNINTELCLYYVIFSIIAYYFWIY